MTESVNRKRGLPAQDWPNSGYKGVSDDPVFTYQHRYQNPYA